MEDPDRSAQHSPLTPHHLTTIGDVRLTNDHLRAAGAGLFVVLLTLLVAQTGGAQQQPQVLKATSKTVDIRDGGKLLKGLWSIDPSSTLDIYDAVRTNTDKTVTFITDIDSLSIQVQPGHIYDFTILLDGNEECHTRISTMTQPYRRAVAREAAGPDTIPITISHGKLHLAGTVNGSKTLDLIFDTGANINVLYPSAARAGAELRLDGVTTNVGTGGATLRQTSRDNRLEVAGLYWEHEPFLYVEKQADRADGIVGYPVFQDKVVEFDYDHMVMIIHPALPPRASDYARTEMRWIRSLTAVEVVLARGEQAWSGPFFLDTGGTGAMNVYEEFSRTHELRRELRGLGTSASRGVGSGVVRNAILLLPELRLAGFTLRDVPIHAELTPGSGGPEQGGTLNMEVLQRFNTFLDYPRDAAYFKPSARFGAPFKVPPTGVPWIIGGAVAGLVLGLAGLRSAMAKRATSSRR